MKQPFRGLCHNSPAPDVEIDCERSDCPRIPDQVPWLPLPMSNAERLAAIYSEYQTLDSTKDSARVLEILSEAATLIDRTAEPKKWAYTGLCTRRHAPPKSLILRACRALARQFIDLSLPLA